MPEQVGDPVGVVDVGLAAGDGLDVAGVHHQQLKRAFQDVVDGLPVFAGALHRHMGDPSLNQPVR